jgi:nitrate/TMAO reductase-like tetraheme cytochrome c subunit
MDWISIVRVVGTIACVSGIILAWLIARRRFSALPQDPSISLGIAILSAASFWKLTAFVGLVVVPVATMGVANYHTFVGVHEVDACARCHVMRPMVNDLQDPASDTLAARHFKNGWIPTGQCFACHSDYGFSGDMAAKMEGFRHLARYTTQTYHEPIVGRIVYNNQNCLKCHGGKIPFEGVHVHHDVRARLESSDMSCLNCHGLAHPSRTDRTPGSSRYDTLMRTPEPNHE